MDQDINTNMLRLNKEYVLELDIMTIKYVSGLLKESSI